METTFGLYNMKLAQELVREYLTKELYPDGMRDGLDELNVKVQILASTGLTTREDFRIYLTTNLPDGMLYEVIQIVGEPAPKLFAYKDVNREELEE